MNIYLDIETIPAQAPDAIEMLRMESEAEKLTIKAPSNYKDETKIAEFLESKKSEIDADFEQKYRKTSFDGALGQIACVSVAIDNAMPVSFYSENYADNETRVVEDLFNMLRTQYSPNSNMRPVFIGHNIVGFDLRFLYQRAVMLGVKPPSFIPFQAKPWDASVYDTMTAWAGFGNRVSLDKLCKVFGIAGKGSEIGEEIDGSMVWDFVKAGRIADVAKYCGGDVIRTREIHKRLTFAESFEKFEMKEAA